MIWHIIAPRIGHVTRITPIIYSNESPDPYKYGDMQHYRVYSKESTVNDKKTFVATFLGHAVYHYMVVVKRANPLKRPSACSSRLTEFCHS